MLERNNLSVFVPPLVLVLVYGLLSLVTSGNGQNLLNAGAFTFLAIYVALVIYRRRQIRKYENNLEKNGF